MTPTLPLRFTLVAQVIADCLGIEVARVTPGAELTSEIACDSLNLMSIDAGAGQ